MTNAEARMTNETRMSNDEDSAALGRRAEVAELPPVGQFSLQTLFYVSLFAALACATVMPIVRGWAFEFQWRFAVGIGVYFIAVGLMAVLSVWSQRVARRSGGELLFYVAHGSSRSQRMSFVTLSVVLWSGWFFNLHLLATGGDLGTFSFINLYILLQPVNVAIFLFAGMRGVQFRQHAIVSGKTRVEWRDISRYSWGPSSTLVVFIKSVRAAVPLGGIPPDQRAAVESLLQEQLARARNADVVAV